MVAESFAARAGYKRRLGQAAHRVRPPTGSPHPSKAPAQAYHSGLAHTRLLSPPFVILFVGRRDRGNAGPIGDREVADGHGSVQPRPSGSGERAIERAQLRGKPVRRRLDDTIVNLRAPHRRPITSDPVALQRKSRCPDSTATRPFLRHPGDRRSDVGSQRTDMPAGRADALSGESTARRVGAPGAWKTIGALSPTAPAAGHRVASWIHDTGGRSPCQHAHSRRHSSRLCIRARNSEWRVLGVTVSDDRSVERAPRRRRPLHPSSLRRPQRRPRHSPREPRPWWTTPTLTAVEGQVR